MMYLSKGIVCRGPDRKRLYVRHLGLPIELTDQEAQIWLEGEFAFAYASSKQDLSILQRLVNRRLIVCEQEHNGWAQYKILCKCVIFPTGRIRFLPLRKTEKNILIWLKKAGFHLSLPELVYLFENEIEPRSDLLYSENRLRLSRLIYPCTIMMANSFENRMMHSIAMKQTVDAVMNLLYRKQVVIM